MLGREDSLWTKLLEQVTDSVGREVWEGESQLDGGGWKNRGRLQQFLEVILLVDLLIEMEGSLVALLENLLQSVFLPQFSAHPVHPEGLLVGKQGLPQVCFACQTKGQFWLKQSGGESNPPRYFRWLLVVGTSGLSASVTSAQSWR